MKRLLLAALAALIFSSPAAGQVAIIELPPGSTPVAVKGHTNPLSSQTYQLKVSPNQRVAIRLTSTSRKNLVRFNLRRDRFTGNPLPGGARLTEWEGVLKEGGDYWVVVFAFPEAGEEDFTLTFSTSSQGATPEPPASSGGAAEASGLDAAKLPAVGTRPQDFAPRGWKIASRAEGDLNRDGRTDQVLHVVTQDTPDDRSFADAAPEAHALVALIDEGGRLRRVGVASELLVPFVPQYTLEMTIRKDGVLVVKQDYGMSDVVNLTHLFRHEAATGRLLLIGKEIFTYTRPLRDDTVKTSENYLTGVRLTTTGHFRRGAGTTRETTKSEQMERRRIYLEDVDENHDN